MTEVYPDREGYWWVKFRCELPDIGWRDYWLVGYWRDEEWWEIHSVDGYVYPNDPRLLQLGTEIERPE